MNTRQTVKYTDAIIIMYEDDWKREVKLPARAIAMIVVVVVLWLIIF